MGIFLSLIKFDGEDELEQILIEEEEQELYRQSQNEPKQQNLSDFDVSKFSISKFWNKNLAENTKEAFELVTSIADKIVYVKILSRNCFTIIEI